MSVPTLYITNIFEGEGSLGLDNLVFGDYTFI